LIEVSNIDPRLDLHIGDIVCNHSRICEENGYTVYDLKAYSICKVVELADDSHTVLIKDIEDKSDLKFSCRNHRWFISSLRDIEKHREEIIKAQKVIAKKAPSEWIALILFIIGFCILFAKYVFPLPTFKHPFTAIVGGLLFISAFALVLYALSPDDSFCEADYKLYEYLKNKEQSHVEY